MTEAPDSPVEAVTVEHEDGTVRTLEGEEARAWTQWVAKTIKFTTKHGGEPPQVEWTEDE